MSLLADAIAGHGGLDHWQRVASLALRVRIGGHILATRLASPRTRTLDVIVDTRRVHAVLRPFPRPGLIGVFDASQIRIETEAGAVVAARDVPADPAARRPSRLLWNDLDVLYFLGYALWNYAVTPFVFTWPGFATREDEPWEEASGVVWRRLNVTFPTSVPTHCREQAFYFDDRGWLRRLDYTADVFGAIARGAHYCHDHRDFGGLVFPTHRIVWPRRRSGRPLTLVSVMEGWIDEVSCRYAPLDPDGDGGRARGSAPGIVASGRGPENRSSG